MDRHKKKEIILVIGEAAGILTFFSLICIVNLFHFNYNMNSDIASDVILGELIWKSGEVIPGTWYTAAETRLICNPNAAALFFGIVRNMTLAAGLACCTMTLMIALSIAYFCKMVGIKRNCAALMVFLCISTPCGLVILELLYLFASYYAVHTAVFFVTLAVHVEMMRNQKTGGVETLICVLLAFVLGLQGARGILVIYGPMCGMETIRNLYLFYRKQKRERGDIILSLWTVSLLLFNFIGTCFPLSVGQGFSRNIRKGFQKLFATVIPDMGRALGFEDTNSLGRLCLGILLLLSFYVLFHILGRMWKRELIEPIEWAWLIVCSSPVVSALMVAFTTVESTQRYYFMLPFLMAFSVVLLWEKKAGGVRKAALIVAVVFVVINLYEIYLPVVHAQEPPDSDRYRVAEFLRENDYPVAYTTFENANAMTVLENGRVRVYPAASMEKMDICKWMSSTDWYCPNMPYEQKTAYVVPDTESEAFGRFLAGKEELVQEVIEIGRYKIYASDYNYSNLGEE